jgi:hypothetical protein
MSAKELEIHQVFGEDPLRWFGIPIFLLKNTDEKCPRHF